MPDLVSDSLRVAYDAGYTHGVIFGVVVTVMLTALAVALSWFCAAAESEFDPRDELVQRRQSRARLRPYAWPRHPLPRDWRNGSVSRPPIPEPTGSFGPPDSGTPSRFR